MTSLSDRIKTYEQGYDYNLMPRVPVIIRVDGRGFSKYTKNIKANKPFDENLSQAMIYATQQTAEMMEGCAFAFTQSDEASFVLFNDQSEEAQPWFGNRLQKIISITASSFTVHFSSKMAGLPCAYFDARAFTVPNDMEAMNYLQWRQQDAVRNSIQLASYYGIASKLGKKTTLKLLHGLNTKQQQEALFKNAGINWNNYPAKFKRGIGVYKETKEIERDGSKIIRHFWKIDEDLPEFSSNKELLMKLFKRNDELVATI